MPVPSRKSFILLGFHMLFGLQVLDLAGFSMTKHTAPLPDSPEQQGRQEHCLRHPTPFLPFCNSLMVWNFQSCAIA
jgi:hypothetical protein